ncbi:TIGR01777 family oxidoreductase [Ureibacillus sinduriensis]|uniref:Multidrug MFS transporter n=1 Tax=Ureibacillus sinduriensis BLB-1 = JCM 15800 TaxID=1384057 RepID=A0A0A3HQR3_9BACL|nr:TIGR01777 family oxidoreductase [Ureibacillus sinduriensis]KGR74926.1 multidrug MFS transporter [Ureibacillus sinduriensis BLB-1 = JCM 15800]
MKIAITGGTGFIGSKLTELLINEGHEIVILTRKEKHPKNGVSYVKWLEEGAASENGLENIDAFINLAGISINGGRWSRKHQKQIYDSRMEATGELLRIIELLPKKPSIFISASAIGIYPVSLQAVYTENSECQTDDFLGRTVYDWEMKARKVEKYNVRTVLMRFGLVLGRDGGALPLMTLPYKFYAGGTVGSGRQWVSWVHIVDVVRAISFALHQTRIIGPVNVTSPAPLTMEEFGKTISLVMNRPHWMPVPSFIMRLALGQKSKLVLEGQKVLPKVLLDEGFQFEFPKLDSALSDLYK